MTLPSFARGLLLLKGCTKEKLLRAQVPFSEHRHRVVVLRGGWDKERGSGQLCGLETGSQI